MIKIEKKPFTELQSERLVLKPHEVSFAYATMVYTIIKENWVYLTRFLDKLLDVKAAEDEFAFFESSNKAWQEMNKAEYGMWTKQGELIGTCGVFNVDYDAASCEIGYWLKPSQTGKGYMTEAVKTLEDEFFARGFNRIIIVMDTENTPSEKVAIRRGYTKEGIMRQWHYNPTFKSYRDMCLYGKLKSEWEKQR